MSYSALVLLPFMVVGLAVPMIGVSLPSLKREFKSIYYKYKLLNIATIMTGTCLQLNATGVSVYPE